jgi:hypothetical protein
MKRFLIGSLVASGLFACACGGLCAEEYTFVGDTTVLIGLIHGQEFRIGRLDKSGNFSPDERWPVFRTDAMLSGIPQFRFINGPATAPTEKVYEYRSGRLVIGSLDMAGNFTPQLGSKIISFEDHLAHYEPGKSPRIYNLPGTIVKKEKKQK